MVDKDKLGLKTLVQQLHLLLLDTCHGLAYGLSYCLKFFNERCDPHLFKEGKPAFTAQTIGKRFKSLIPMLY